MTSEAPEAAGEGRPTRNRISIAERAARRDYLESHGRDRYDSLLRHLRAGRELEVERRGRFTLEWHPIANRLLLAFALVVAAYLVVSTVANQLREQRVDTWTGPDGASATVQSGQRLASCPALSPVNDPVFPNWIRFDGSVFQPVDAQLPVGPSNIGRYYHESGYALGSLRIYRVTVSGLGEPGTRILIRTGEAPAGELYGVIPGCS